MVRLNPSAYNKAHLLLTLVLCISSFTLTEPLETWILLIVCCATIIRFSLFMNWQKHQISLRTLNLLAILSAIVLATFGWQLGLLLGMLNLLVLASSLKLMLLASRRDYFQLISIQFFLIGTGLVFNQNIAFSLLYGALTMMLLLSLAFHISPVNTWSGQIKRTGKLCLQAVPLCIMLFLVTPKLGPMWQMPVGKGGETGLSDKVTPGDLSQLARSSDLAFRVNFDDDIPVMSERYWRALVLEDFDGKSWQVAPFRERIRQRYQRTNHIFTPRTSGPGIAYQVLSEPSKNPWLFGLDLAVTRDNTIWQGREYQLISRYPLQSGISYRVRSYTQAPLLPDVELLDRRLNLQLPEQGNPRTREWAANLRQRHDSDKAFIGAVSNYFQEQEFRYTLNPSPMPTNAMDQFLFEDRAGFCVHYAGAMAYALRLGGIPARMVTGYLGGEMRGEEYMSVYQYDAHAWVEWLSENGWQRLDPTALVSPLRLEFGLQRAVEYEDSFMQGSALSRLQQLAWVNELRMLLADMDYLWSRWILGFDRDNQEDMLKALLGEVTPLRLALAGAALVLFTALLLAIYQYKHWLVIRHSSPAYYYHKGLRLLERSDIERPRWMGPQDFNSLVQQQQPAHVARQFDKMTRCYLRSSYETRDDAEQQILKKRMRFLLAKLKKALKKKPPAKRQGF
ncbi:transglutaminase family protein [Lacimicrobium alkaliphilum]|uniref:Transglutaminase n=2 Tax=Lacimicrobium alkaliphilum TaxID=1526571 RepID=A0ABQ1RND4_9ALTE|nr:DUF3488 and transglutaminase-like domain-containing protein [Lacimicrobium alkaliphilum]GGD75733.1 transglutaminase [Lacimicrobium alkaliphilum]